MAEVFEGFNITSIKMRDYETKQVLWKHDNWDLSTVIEAHIPRSILSCKAVAREIMFSSANEIDSLSLVQEVKLHDSTIEVWSFDFGFVIPNSENVWEQVIYAGDADEMLSADILSGNIVILTTFYQGKKPIHKSSVRIFYD